MDSYLSGGERYPTFEQPGPVVQNLDFCVIGIPSAHDLGFDWLKTISWDFVNVFSYLSRNEKWIIEEKTLQGVGKENILYSSLFILSPPVLLSPEMQQTSDQKI